MCLNIVVFVSPQTVTHKEMNFTNALCVLFLTHPLLISGENMKPGAWILSVINCLLPLSVPTRLIAICLLSAWCVLSNIIFEKLLVKKKRMYCMGKPTQSEELDSAGSSWKELGGSRWMISSQGIANETFLVLRYSAGQQKLNEL